MKKLYFSLLTFLFLVVAHAQIVNIPDANFKAKLLAASPSYPIASTDTPTNYYDPIGGGEVYNYNQIDLNNDGEIQVSEALSITYLNLNDSEITNLEGINNFINLESLKCGGNLLQNINLSSSINLKYLYVSSNPLLQNLNLNGFINLRKLTCVDTSLITLDLNNLTNLQYIDCSYNTILQSLTVTNLNNLEYLYCYENQLQSFAIDNLNALKYLDCSNSQISNLDLNGLLNLETLVCSYNQLSVLEINNLNNLKNLDCSRNSISSLDISNLVNLENLDSSWNTLQGLFIKNSNINWTNLNFSENPNLKFICSDEEDLTFVQQKVNSLGYSNCQVNTYCNFVPGGIYYTIQGDNNFDANNNGCDATDSFYPKLKFTISDGLNTGSLISNNLGNYSIPVQEGMHTITPQFENPGYFTVSPANAVLSFPTQTSPFIQNFCIAPNGVNHDLEVVIIPLTVARPGFDALYKIKYKNKGNLNEAATVNFNYNEDILDFVFTSVALTAQSAGLLSWNLGTIAPFQTGEIIVALNVNSPVETPAVNADDILNYTTNIVGLNTDETPDDNTFVLNQTVVNSFDPNDKTCLEGNTINPSMIGKFVHYKIRFENTGTFPAQNVVIKDIIDTSKFDLSTLQMTDASHNCITRITNPNKVEFIFEGINLPFDDANNDGYVVFKIKTKPTLTVNSTISNLANIYFDYNFPIVTNTATSTFQVLKTDTFAFDNYFSIYPNPVKNELYLSIKQATTVYSLSIYNTLGQQVQTTTNPEKTIDVSGLKTGNYIVKVTTDKGVSSSKFVKQ